MHKLCSVDLDKLHVQLASLLNQISKVTILAIFKDEVEVGFILIIYIKIQCVLLRFPLTIVVPSNLIMN